MQTILGFLFDFKSNAGKTFKKVRSEIVKTTKEWGKQYKTFGKAMEKSWKMVKLQTKAAHGEFILFAEKIKRMTPSITDIIGSIGDTFGGVAGIIADTLLRPGALVAGGLAVAGRSAASFADSLTMVRRETMLTGKDMQRLDKSLKDISASTRAPLTQIQSLATHFSSANISIEEFNDLMLSAISMNRLTGQETSEYADEIQNMRIQLGMGSKDIKDFYNTLYAANKVTEASQAQVSRMVPFIISQVQDNLPKALHKIGMESGVILASSLSAALGDHAPEVMSKFFSVVTDRSSEGRYRLAAIAEGLGAEFSSQFSAALDSGDVGKAFQAFQKGLKSLNMDQMLSIKQAMGDVFGFDVSTMKKIANVREDYMSIAQTTAQIAKNEDWIIRDGKELLTTTQRWHKLWGDIERLLLPFGEVLLNTLMSVVDWAGKLLSPVIAFVNSLDAAGKKAVMVGAALATVAFWMKPITGIGMQIINIFTQSSLMIRKTAMSIGAWFLSAKVGAGIAAQGAGRVATAWMGIKLAISSAGAALGGFIAAAWSILWPILAVTLVFKVIEPLIKKIFSPKALEMFSKALNFIFKLVEGIVWYLMLIPALMAAIWDGGESLSNWWGSAPWKDRPSETPAQKSSSKLVDYSMETNNYTETVRVDDSSPSFQSSDSMHDVRTSELVDAQKENTAATYESAELIIKALQALLSGEGSPLFRGGLAGLARHAPVPEAMNLGGPR